METSKLFSLAYGEAVQICHVAIGNRNKGPLSISKYNTNNSDATITCVMKLFDDLFLAHNVCAFFNKANNRLYLEINEKAVVTDGSTVWKEKGISVEDIFKALFLWNIHTDIKDEALPTFISLVNGIINDNTSVLTAYRLCDNFYWLYIKTHHEVEIVPIVIEEYEAAFRKGELEPLEEFSQIVDLPKSKLGTVKPQTVVLKPKFSEKFPKKDCLEGKFKLPYAWNSDEYIPSMSMLKNYVETDEYYKLLNKIEIRLGEKVIPRINKLSKKYGDNYDRLEAIGDDYINVTLCGKPGTGKSIMVRALGATLGMPVYVINNSQNTDEDEYEGKTKMVNGKPTAVPTDVIKAFKYGGICLLEEINLPHAAVVMGALGQAVEAPFVLKEDGYIPIKRHPLCVFISTMNVGTVGSKIVSQPFANRFKQTLVMKDPNKNDFINILMARTGEKKKLCSWVYNCYEKIINAVNSSDGLIDAEEILMMLSVRSCIGAIENIQEGYDEKEAIEDSIIGKIAEVDLKVAEICKETLYSTIADYAA